MFHVHLSSAAVWEQGGSFSRTASRVGVDWSLPTQEEALGNLVATESICRQSLRR